MKNIALLNSIKGSILITLIIVSQTITSCSKSDSIDQVSEGPATVSISLAGIETETTDANLGGKSASTTVDTQPASVEIPVNKDLSAYLRLEEENNSTSSVKNKINSNKLAATSTETSPVNLGVKYGILVYDGDALIENGHKIFTAGKEAETEGFALFGGKTYTFIAYSINSGTLPDVSDMSKLSTATIKDVSGDLLYQKQTQLVNRGVNNLKIKLKHKYTLITTELKVGTTYGGKIQYLQNTNFDQLRQSATIKFSNDNISYSDTKTFKLIEFETIPQEGVSSIVSTPNLLIAPSATNTVTFAIPSIRVNGQTHNIAATTFNFQAGKKYKLTVTFDVPCSSTTTTSSLAVNSTINDVNALEAEALLATPTNGGKFILNFKKLDNSFNIYINDQPIFTRKYLMASRKKTNGIWGSWVNENTYRAGVAADMEGQTTDGQLINSMQFSASEADKWGSNSISNIWDITGPVTSPVLRVTIDQNGVVTVTAKKTTASTTQITLINRAEYTIPSATGNRTDRIFKKTVSTDGLTETAISKIQFVTNTVNWNKDNTKNTIKLSMDQSSKPTVGDVEASGTTFYNTTNCN